MDTLKFGQATSLDGFTPLSTAHFSDLQPARIVRELLQNSLDAATEAGEACAHIHFQTEKIHRRDIPDVKGYSKAFDSAVKYHKKHNQGELPDAAAEVVNRIQDSLRNLSKGSAILLSVTDNGVGLNADRMNRLLGEGSSGKSSSASGSYGVGHLAPMSLSDLRYILYAGLTQDGNRIACGKTILAIHPEGGSRNKRIIKDAKGYLIQEFSNGIDGNLYDFLPPASHPKIFVKHLDDIAEKWGHGCAVLIPAFNNFHSSKTSLWEIVSKVAAYNFAPAIYREKLILTVSEAGNEQKLDAESLKRLLNQEQDKSRAARSDGPFAGLRPSGQNAYSILEAITKGGGQRIKTNQSAARINLLAPSPYGTTRIDLFRNGMWITDDIHNLRATDFADRQPFHAVIEISAEDGGELHRLIRKAEGPMHNSLSFNRLSQNEQDDLSNLLSKIAEYIRAKAPEATNESYTIDDFLVIESDNEGIGGKAKFSFWGRPTTLIHRSAAAVYGNTPEPNPNPPGPEPPVDPPDNPIDPPGPHPGPRTTRPTSVRSAIAPIGKSRLIGSITIDKDMPEAWVALRVDENADPTCDRIWQDEDVTFKSFQIKPTEPDAPPLKTSIIEDGRFVKIHGIAASANYEVQAEYNAPPELTNIVNNPILRLELHRPPPKPKGKQTQKNTEKPQDANEQN